ncbi:F18 fimbrial protein FedE [Escherichia coli]|nr:F18 fimbrial protein FedE [Escherichia coli]MWS16289.1 F18 fimbrial protein FedE [Escherichia coli]
MTGAEFRAMKFTNAALAALMMTVMTSSGQAATLITAATLTINVTFTQPSCDITVPPLYSLGTLTPGTNIQHAPMEITWKCEGNAPITTALTASIAKGSASGVEGVVLKTTSDTDTGVTLSLREKVSNELIKLTGGDYFCSDQNSVPGVTMRTCTLTPETNVSPGGPFGLASATLRFEVVYP